MDIWRSFVTDANQARKTKNNNKRCGPLTKKISLRPSVNVLNPTSLSRWISACQQEQRTRAAKRLTR